MKNLPKFLIWMIILLISSHSFAQEINIQNNSNNLPDSKNIKSSVLNDEVAVTINVSTTTGDNAEGSEITLTGYEYPYEIYTAILDTSETVTFDSVYKGQYNVEIDKIGYYIYSDDYNFINDTSINIILAEKCYSPYNLYVDPLTLIATWHAARITQIREDFNDVTFPPEEWQSSTVACGWFATTDGSSANWTIPTWDSQYACANDDACGVGTDGSLDYLITPKLDLRESPDFSLKFDSYYDGGNGQLAFVEYSLDGGSTWETLTQMSPSTSWEYIEIDLSAFSGPLGESEIWLAFHADDAGGWATGWAVDNVEVSVGSDSDWPPLGYYVFLDEAFVAAVTGTTYTFLDLMWGQTYIACVATMCSSGMSEYACYEFTSEYLYPPINLHGDTINSAASLIWYPPCAPGKLKTDEGRKKILSNSSNENHQKKQENSDGSRCVVPDNLLGFNVYRDEAFVDYVEYNGEDSIIWGQPMQPGTYSYSVTAEYDVTVYGGTGTAESMHEGPVSIQVSYGYPLPFVEDWSSGSFEVQQWLVGCNNWIINGNMGNPAPSAKFLCVPVLTNYDYGIVSYPILGSEIVNEEIYLEFDYMLDDSNETGLEFMTVRIWENGNWHEVANFANEGDVDWTEEHIDISAFAQGNDFKIGFFANGTNSMDIEAWFIDNIYVYSECKAPYNLTGEIEDWGTFIKVYLNWQLYDPPIEEWIQYDNGNNSSAIGLSGGGAFEVSAYWPASTMGQYIGAYLTEVEVYIDDSTTTAMIKIYGEGTIIEPGDLLAEKSFNGTAESWITVELDIPVPINGEDLWIGYYGDCPAPPEFFAGCDSGPAVAGFGDMISMDGITFESMSIAYGLDYNWNIHGFVTNTDGDTVIIKPVEATPVTYTGGIPFASEMNYTPNVAPYKHRDFVSFSIYLNDEILVENLTDTTYTDTINNIWIDYTYFVTAIYDNCISDPSNEVSFYFYPWNIDENNSNNLIQIFPNPAIDIVNVNSKADINKIIVFDDLGKLVYEKKVVEDNNIKINTASFDAGVYFVKIYTNEGVVVRKVAITK